MKIKVTRKDIRNSFRHVFSCGYCDLQNIFNGESPRFYNCGVYGWNFDCYEVYGLTICTGYRNMPGRTARNISHYEKLAREIASDYKIPWEEQRERIEKLLKEFCEQA